MSVLECDVKFVTTTDKFSTIWKHKWIEKSYMRWENFKCATLSKFHSSIIHALHCFLMRVVQKIDNRIDKKEKWIESTHKGGDSNT